MGEPPKVEVTIENLNDNVDKQFLHNMIAKHGPYEEMHIYYHPAKRKHLGLARIVFEEVRLHLFTMAFEIIFDTHCIAIQVRSAKSCVDVLHGKSVMGKHLQCYLDPTGASCKKVFQDLTTEKKPEPHPPPPPPTLSDAAAVDNDDGDQSPKEKSNKKSPEDSKWDRQRDSRDSRDPRGSVEHRKRLERRRSDHNSDPRERDRDRDRDRERHQRERDGERNSREHEDFWRDGPLQSVHGHRVPPPPPVHWERGEEKSRGGGGGREERSSSFESYSHPPPPLPPPPPVLSSSSAQESHYAPTRLVA